MRFSVGTLLIAASQGSEYRHHNLKLSCDYKTMASAFTPGEQDNSCSSECCKCMEENLPKMMDAAKSYIDALCDKTKCPHMQKACRWAKQNAEEAFGLVAQKIGLVPVVFGYCVGRGVCKVPDHPHETMQTGWSLKPTSQASDATEMLLVDLSMLTDNPFSSPDSTCMHKTIAEVMKKAAARTETKCDKTPCPYIKRICAWSRAHPKESLGMLLGLVEPWKFAAGRCSVGGGEMDA